MLRLQRVHPPGEMYPQLAHGEGVQQRLHKLPDTLGVQRLTVRHDGLQPEGALQIRLHFPRRLPRRVAGVDDHQEGLPRFLHVGDGALFRLYVILPGNFRNGAVGGHHNADGAVPLHDLFRPQLRRFRHGNLMVVPGGGHHPRHAVFLRAHRAVHHVAHGVDQPHPQLCDPVRGNLHRLLGDELRLRSHDGLPGAALGQLISGALLAIGVGDAGNHQLLHNPFDEGRFSGTHRPDHAHINIAAGSGSNVRINLIHSQPPSRQEKGSCAWLVHGMSPAGGLEPDFARLIFSMRMRPVFYWRNAEIFVKKSFDK